MRLFTKKCIWLHALYLPHTVGDNCPIAKSHLLLLFCYHYKQHRLLSTIPQMSDLQFKRTQFISLLLSISHKEPWELGCQEKCPVPLIKVNCGKMCSWSLFRHVSKLHLVVNVSGRKHCQVAANLCWTHRVFKAKDEQRWFATACLWVSFVIFHPSTSQGCPCFVSEMGLVWATKSRPPGKYHPVWPPIKGIGQFTRQSVTLPCSWTLMITLRSLQLRSPAISLPEWLPWFTGSNHLTQF